MANRCESPRVCRNGVRHNIDREERTIRVYSQKTGDWRTVYFQEDLDFLLDQWIDAGYRDSYGPSDQSPYLFPSQRSEQIDLLYRRKDRQEGCRGCWNLGSYVSGRRRIKQTPYTPHAIRHGHTVHSLRCGLVVRSRNTLVTRTLIRR